MQLWRARSSDVRGAPRSAKYVGAPTTANRSGPVTRRRTISDAATSGAPIPRRSLPPRGRRPLSRPRPQAEHPGRSSSGHCGRPIVHDRDSVMQGSRPVGSSSLSANLDVSERPNSGGISCSTKDWSGAELPAGSRWPKLDWQPKRGAQRWQGCRRNGIALHVATCSRVPWISLLGSTD
jgi:hypothetical protein